MLLNKNLNFRNAMIAATALSASAAIFPEKVVALEGDQCYRGWNLAATYLVINKKMISQNFIDSVKSSFFVMEDGISVKQADGKPLLRACNNEEKREIYIKKIEDAATFDLIDDAADEQKRGFRGAFSFKAADKVEPAVQRWLAARSNSNSQDGYNSDDKKNRPNRDALPVMKPLPLLH